MHVQALMVHVMNVCAGIDDLDAGTEDAGASPSTDRVGDGCVDTVGE